MPDNSIEYIAHKSKEFLANQISSYRSLHQKAGTIIAVSAVFAPLFLFLMEKAQLLVRLVAAILIAPMIVGIILLLLTLRATKLNQGYDESNFEDLMNEELKEVHKKEIAYNKYSIEQNDTILVDQNRKYNLGVACILTAVILSFLLMITDTVTKNTNSNTNNQPKTEKVMADEDKKTTSSTDADGQKKETLPKVDPSKVKRLNEGVDPKKAEQEN